MPRAIGANSKLYMVTEVTYGTSPGGNWRLMPFISCDLGAEQPFVDADVIGLAPNRDVAAPFKDTVTVQGQAVVPVDENFIGDWLRLLLGAPNTTGSAPNYIHRFDSGGTALPSASMELAFPDVPNFDVIAGVRADTMEIDFSPTGAATATFGLIGQGSTRAGTTSAGTPTTRTYTAFNKAQGIVRRNTTALGQITGGRVNFSNGIEVVRTIRDDFKIEGADPGLSRATGQLTARFENTTLLNDAINGTAIALEFEYRLSADRRLTVTLEQTYLSVAKTPITGPTGVEVTFEFRAAFDATATRMMTVTLRNAIASYA